MQPRTKIALFVAAPVLAAAWYLFRPELLFVNATVNEQAPASAKSLAEGAFASYAHETVGLARLVDAGGRRYLRVESLRTSNGPDVRVYLVKGDDPRDVREGRFLDLGALKGNIGSQSYEIPDAASIGEYGAVSLWCRRFSVNFGGATLQRG